VKDIYLSTVYILFLQYTHGKFRSDAEERIAKVAPIVVDGMEAICDGGGGMNGHPIEYIDLDTVQSDLPSVCKYCGLRFISAKRAGKKGHH
jgi:uncharacterized Zn-finger protein